MKDLITVKMGIEQSAQHLQSAFVLRLDELKERFQEVINKEVEAFLKYGLSASIKQQAEQVVKKGIEDMIYNAVRDSRDKIMTQIKEELQDTVREQAENNVRILVRKASGKLAEDDQY